VASENGKDVANSLSGYSNALNKGTNAVLDSANQINKWYAEQVNKIAGEENQDTRLETNVDNTIEEDTEEKINKIQTKVDDYTEIQTNNKNKLISNQNTGRLKTINTDETLEEAVEKENEVKDFGSKKGKINGKIAMVGNSSFMWKVLKMPMEFFSQRLSGDILQRQSSNASIASTLVDTFTPLLLNIVMMFFYLFVMIRYSLMLTLVGISAISINLILSRVITKQRENITKVATRDRGKLAGATIAGIKMVETIKASGAENGYFQKWAGYQASSNGQQVKFKRLNSFLGQIPNFTVQLANMTVLILGVYLVIKGQFSIGAIMTFQGFLSAFMSPAMTLIASGESIQLMRTEMERVDDVMKYPDDEYFKDEPADVNKDYDKLAGKVELKNVTFGYSKLAEPLIENFSMTMEPGSRVAFVGASGCGKSTLSKLISGLYKPWSGEVLFDGKPIGEIDRTVFKGSVAVVDQDIVLFEDTIDNNIRMWNNSIKDFEVMMAAKDAQIYNDITAREGGFASVLTEGGKDLSGGQKQRIEIARVLAQDPSVIIMDEATSALDAKTEYELVKAVKDRGITCIVIAHRLSTIRDCDEIIVLDQGKVAERGKHEELMALGGLYTELVASD